MATSSKIHKREHHRGLSFTDYLPLIVIVVLTMAAATARSAEAGQWEAMDWMHDFMGFFLVVFSMFKFFDMPGFADGFQMYDLLAKPFRPYAYVYPFIELGLGLAYLARWTPVVTYSVTIGVMLWGAAGVLLALKKGLDINCACMGTVLKVPLSTVALVEDLGMASMAGAMLMAGK
ncbi:MAG: MauE/DoxX family redox-associated membrane protein [Roseimicrobium sp.]